MKLARRVACLPWFFELAHSALNIFPSGQRHIAALTPSACIEVFLPYIFLLILVEVLKDALQPNFQQVEDGRLRALVQDLPAVLL